jgi:hypothetical protein
MGSVITTRGGPQSGASTVTEPALFDGTGKAFPELHVQDAAAPWATAYDGPAPK